MRVTDPSTLEVKNKLPAAIQITAEQILRDAAEYQSRDPKPRNRVLVDNDELTYYKAQRRKEFEDAIRRQRHHIGNWIKYALWEANQNDFQRARSVFERALQVDGTNHTIWLRYIEAELKGKNVNAARNLFDRVTSLLPRVDQFWFKYAHLEQLLGNYAGARSIYERWMKWNPDERGWLLYAKFEETCGEVERASQVYTRFIENRPSCRALIKFSKFKERLGDIGKARAALLKTFEIIPREHITIDFIKHLAQFEERHKNYKGSEHVYEQGIELLPNHAEALHAELVALKKRRSQGEDLDALIARQRRTEYEKILQEAADCHPYDVWFDYIDMETQLAQRHFVDALSTDFQANKHKLGAWNNPVSSEESYKEQLDRISALYERAVAQVPRVDTRSVWRRFGYLWYGFGVHCELLLRDIELAISVYRKALQILPPDFAKPWIFLAQALVRNNDLEGMRKTFGLAIAKCRKPKIFTTYASIELGLGNIERCRLVHAKYIETWPSSPQSWMAFVDLEIMLDEKERVRALCEAAIAMDYLENPESVWNRYIELEREWSQMSMVRNLYERLLLKSSHPRVFINYSRFEYEMGELETARAIIQRGLDLYKIEGSNVDRAQLHTHLLEMETKYSTPEFIKKARDRMPRKILKKSKLDNGQVVEQVVHVFPDDGQGASKMLKAALKWKETRKSDTQTNA